MKYFVIQNKKFCITKEKNNFVVEFLRYKDREGERVVKYRNSILNGQEIKKDDTEWFKDQVFLLSTFVLRERHAFRLTL